MLPTRALVGALMFWAGASAALAQQAPEQAPEQACAPAPQALAASAGDIRATLEVLRIPRKTFYDKVERHGIDLTRHRRRR